MSTKSKQELRKAFKEIKQKAGIYYIKNLNENRLYLQASTDLDRAPNSDLFQLKANMHPVKKLQEDWVLLGCDTFEFGVFDQLKIDNTQSQKEIDLELKLLLSMHLRQLEDMGQLTY